MTTENRKKLSLIHAPLPQIVFRFNSERAGRGIERKTSGNGKSKSFGARRKEF